MDELMGLGNEADANAANAWEADLMGPGQPVQVPSQPLPTMPTAPLHMPVAPTHEPVAEEDPFADLETSMANMKNTQKMLNKKKAVLKAKIETETKNAQRLAQLMKTNSRKKNGANPCPMRPDAGPRVVVRAVPGRHIVRAAACQ